MGNAQGTNAYVALLVILPIVLWSHDEYESSITSPISIWNRGAKAKDAQAGLFIFVFACTIVIIIFMSLLVRSVRLQESASDR